MKETVIQFGEGNFLRGFFDYFLHKMNEKGAFCDFLGSQPALDPGQKKIFIADRGYPSYNVLAHVVHNGQLCVLRASKKFIKDLCRNALPLDDEPSFDKVLTFHFGRHQSKKYKQYENYHYLKPKTRYDFLERGSDDVDRLQLRILKFPISEDSFEYIVTTLPANVFSLEKMQLDIFRDWCYNTVEIYLGEMIYDRLSSHSSPHGLDPWRKRLRPRLRQKAWKRRNADERDYCSGGNPLFRDICT